MGLIRALADAASGTLADQWLEMFHCDAIDVNTLVVRGQKVDRNGNNKGHDNIISNGSRIVVNEGQCMIIVDNGKVTEICSEAGEYKYDASTEPSIFCGNLWTGIKESFKTFGKRFTMGGELGKEQRVYYFNTKEILDRKFGTATPFQYQMTDIATNKSFTVKIRCRGRFSYQIVDPIVFYTKICGNVTESYEAEQIDQMLKAELLGYLQPAVASMSVKKYDLMQLTASGPEVKEKLNELLTEEWLNKRGLQVSSFTFESIDMDAASLERFNKMQDYAAMSDPNISLGMMAQAQAEAMKSAASNTGGAMMGFAGLNMASQAGGNMMAGFAQAQQANMMMNQQMQQQQMMQQQQQQQMQPQAQAVAPAPTQESAPAAPAADEWTCSCGTKNTGKFCLECGLAKPAPAAPAADPYGWTCTCGAFNKGKFCPECGSPKPADAKVYKCDKCGWEPEDKENPPKFCPQCGDRFDDNDIVK